MFVAPRTRPLCRPYMNTNYPKVCTLTHTNLAGAHSPRSDTHTHGDTASPVTFHLGHQPGHTATAPSALRCGCGCHSTPIPVSQAESIPVHVELRVRTPVTVSLQARYSRRNRVPEPLEPENPTQLGGRVLCCCNHQGFPGKVTRRRQPAGELVQTAEQEGG